jgi:hypothetical protein
MDSNATNHLGRNTFILGRDLTGNVIGPLEYFHSENALESYISENSATAEGELILLNGVLANAFSIPDSVPENVEIFLVVPNAFAEKNGVIINVRNLKVLEETIMTLLQNTIVVDDSSDVNKGIELLDTQELHDLYVLYGYEIDLYFRYESDEVDEEIVQSCSAIYNRIAGAQ